MRVLIVASLAALLAGCGPGPVRMAASEAAQVLERFASGEAPADVCTPVGRATLRGAVRAYAGAMAANGVVWPAMDAPGRLEFAVLSSIVVGLIEPEDLRASTRAGAQEIAAHYLSEISAVGGSARVACAEAALLQREASRYAMEEARRRDLVQHARGNGQSAAANADRQSERTLRAQLAMRAAVRGVEARIASRTRG